MVMGWDVGWTVVDFYFILDFIMDSGFIVRMTLGMWIWMAERDFSLCWQ